MRELLWTHRRLFFAVAAFSFFVNLLQLLGIASSDD